MGRGENPCDNENKENSHNGFKKLLGVRKKTIWKMVFCFYIKKDSGDYKNRILLDN